MHLKLVLGYFVLSGVFILGQERRCNSKMCLDRGRIGTETGRSKHEVSRYMGNRDRKRERQARSVSIEGESGQKLVEASIIWVFRAYVRIACDVDMAAYILSC